MRLKILTLILLAGFITSSAFAKAKEFVCMPSEGAGSQLMFRLSGTEIDFDIRDIRILDGQGRPEMLSWITAEALISGKHCVPRPFVSRDEASVLLASRDEPNAWVYRIPSDVFSTASFTMNYAFNNNKDGTGCMDETYLCQQE